MYVDGKQCIKLEIKKNKLCWDARSTKYQNSGTYYSHHHQGRAISGCTSFPQALLNYTIPFPCFTFSFCSIQPRNDCTKTASTFDIGKDKAARFWTSAMTQLRFSLFLAVAQCWLVCYCHFQIGYWSHIHEWRYPRRFGHVDPTFFFSTTHCSLSRLIVRSGLDVPTYATRHLHACHHARAPSGGRWNCGREMSGNFA